MRLFLGKATSTRQLFAIGISGCFSCISLAVLASAQEGVSAAPDWIAACSNEVAVNAMRCTVSHTVTVAETGRALVTITLHSDAESQTLHLRLPHGLDLNYGVGVAVDAGAAERFGFTTSDASGVYAAVPFAETLRNSLIAGSVLKIDAVGARGRSINIEVSLEGFSEALSLLP